MASINYNDKRFTSVNSDKKAALSQNEKMYDNMINQSDGFYQKQIDASKQWADKQTEIQNQQTDFAIEKIEQQKEQAKKDYTKEQSGAYVDWQKQSDAYGGNAERMAAQGLTNTGYSETSQVSMYNTYQNRVATARESYNLTILNYNNAIKDARLQNSAALAEIAYKAQQQQLELALQGFQYKNTLLLDKAKTKREIDNTYYARYQDVVNQINTENALAEEKRQYNETLKFQKEQAAKDNAIEQAQLALQREELAFQKSKYSSSKVSSSKSSSSKSSSKKSSKKSSSSTKKSTKMTAVEQSTAKKAKSSGSSNILDMGYGPLSAKGASDLVDKGVLTYTTDKNGNVKFSKKVTLPTMKKYRG